MKWDFIQHICSDNIVWPERKALHISSFHICQDGRYRPSFFFFFSTWRKSQWYFPINYEFYMLEYYSLLAKEGEKGLVLVAPWSPPRFAPLINCLVSIWWRWKVKVHANHTNQLRFNGIAIPLPLCNHSKFLLLKGESHLSPLLQVA